MEAVQFFGTTLALSGVWIVVLERMAARKLKEAQTWPATQGIVRVSKVKKRGFGGNAFRAKVTYSYLVGDRELVGRRISLAAETDFAEVAAAARAESYPEGSPVTVYYNPRNPREAYLELCHEGKHFRTMLGIASIIIGVAFATGIWPVA